MSQTNNSISMEQVNKLAETFYNSRSVAFVYLLHNNSSVPKSFYEELKKELDSVRLMTDMLEKIPQNFSAYRTDIAKLLLDQKPAMVAKVIKILANDSHCQKKVLNWFYMEKQKN